MNATSLRVLTSEWSHETNTFNKYPTTLENFEAQHFIEGHELIKEKRKGTKTEIGAAIEMGTKFNWNLHAAVAASANPSGKLSIETFEHIANLIVHESENNLDGILLFLHGAMVAEHYEDAEGELLARLRNKVGPSVPIIVTLDLHANVSEAMTKHSTILLAVRTYPHIDFYETALRAANLLQDCMLGVISPQTILFKNSQMYGLDGGKTQKGPMKELIDRSYEMESQSNYHQYTTNTMESVSFEYDSLLVISICAGFTAADTHDTGPSVTITVNTNDLNVTNKARNGSKHEDPIAMANKIGYEFMNYIWSTRNFQSQIFLSISEAIQTVENHSKSDSSSCKPLVMADVSDNPGSGHYGDATLLLDAIIQSPYLHDVIFYSIFDADAVQQGVAIGVGNQGTITVGGKTDPLIGGGPLSVIGTVVSITNGQFPTYGPMGGGGVWQNYGLSLMFRMKNNIDIIMISRNAQFLDMAQMTSLGSDPIHKKLIVVKSKHHFRASLESIADEILLVDGGGLGSLLNFPSMLDNKNLKNLYKNVRRPIWPLDDTIEWE